MQAAPPMTMGVRSMAVVLWQQYYYYYYYYYYHYGLDNIISVHTSTILYLKIEKYVYMYIIGIGYYIMLMSCTNIMLSVWFLRPVHTAHSMRIQSGLMCQGVNAH